MHQLKEILHNFLLSCIARIKETCWQLRRYLIFKQNSFNKAFLFAPETSTTKAYYTKGRGQRGKRIPHFLPSNNHPKALRCILIGAISIFTLGIIVLCSSFAWGGANSTVHLNVSDTSISYGGYETHEMHVGNSVAYCAEPARATPSKGSYARQTIKPLTNDSGYAYDKRTIAATLWFGWGGPGFDASIWPKKWHDGTAMSAHKYWALTHIVLSDFYTANHNHALYGCSDEFSNWAKGNVLSYDSAQNPHVVGASQSKIRERIDEVPQEFIDGCYQLDTGSNTQIVVSFESGGWIDLDKDSANSSITSLNKSYSLKNARYGIYRSAADANNDTRRVQVLTTNDKSYAKSTYLKSGTYYIKEISAGKGYELDARTYTAVVKHNGTTHVNGEHVYDPPAHDTPDLIIEKYDAQTNSATTLGNATLENAQFTIEYYDALYDNAEKAQKSGEPTRTWIFKTNKQGQISLQDKSSLIKGSLYYTPEGKAALPLGSYVIRETKPPTGYLRNSEVFFRTVTQTKGFSAKESFKPLTHKSAVKEQIIQGGVRLNKLDAESKMNTPLGGGSLNATFEIITTSKQNVVVGGKAYKPNEVVYTGQAQKNAAGGYAFTTDANNDGIDTTLPYGTYRIIEKIPGIGYQASQHKIEFSITEHKKVVQISNDATFNNQIKRGDIELIKVNEKSMARLSGIPFKITSETTGESHVVVTDENGYASTAASWNKHTTSTNANDALLTSPTSQAKPEAGVWFGSITKDKSTAVNDALGALPFDTYTLQELRCPANQGLTLVNIPGIAVKRDKTTVQLGTIDNHEKTEPYLHTSASDGDDRNKILPTHHKTLAVDQVEYGGLTPHAQYVLTSKIYDNTTQKLLEQTGAKLTFTPTQSSGKLTVKIPLDTRNLSGHSLTIFEELAKDEDTLVTHHDPHNTEQALVVSSPHISTKAYDSLDGDQTLMADTSCSITDAVSYQNLVPNQAYTLTGKLIEKKSGKEIAQTEKSFTPQHTAGTTNVSFTFNAYDIECLKNFAEAADSVELVVTETLKLGEKELCQHANLDDENQTVVVTKPTLSTFAFSTNENNKLLSLSESAELTDRITYEGLSTNTAYQIIGIIANPESAHAFDFNEVNADRHSTTNTTETPSFNELLHNAIHPNSTHEGSCLTALKPGDTLDTRKLQELLKQDEHQQNLAIVQHDIVPTQPQGTTSTTFKFNPQAAAGKGLVVFEYLVKDGVIVACHNDVHDALQQFFIEDLPPETPNFEQPEPPAQTENTLPPKEAGILSKTYDSLKPFAVPLICLTALMLVIAAHRHLGTLSRKGKILDRLINP